MLKELTICNFALIDELHIRLEPGLNVLTGETGAGKSIIINAINLIVGERADVEQIRSGADVAIVEALFDIRAHNALRELLRNEGWQDIPDELVIRREVQRSGRSRCTINHRGANVKLLKRVGALLIDIHGQHEHQSLVRPEAHLHYLDQFGSDSIAQLRSRYQSLYDALQRVEQRRRQLLSSEREREQRIDLLRYQINEIDAAQLQLGEEEELTAERQRLMHAEKLASVAQRAVQLLSGDEESLGAVGMIGEVVSELQRAVEWDGNLEQHRGELEGILYQLEDIAVTLSDYAAHVEFNPSRLEEVESRLALLKQLKRKYGDSIEEILAYRQRIGEELEALESYEVHVEELERQATELRHQLEEVAVQLSNARRDAATQLERAMTKQLRSLMMDKTRFKVSIVREADENGLRVDGECVAFNREGIDEVEFLIAPNPGEPLKPLAKIASGGELSRTMLALKALLQRAHEIPTLIFDEIDVGIGGRTAEAIGAKLKDVARYAQVICVTHLPQIACMADLHLGVEKAVVRGRTIVRVRELKDDERIRELARMLAGAQITSTSLRHAEELLARSAK